MSSNTHGYSQYRELVRIQRILKTEVGFFTDDSDEEEEEVEAAIEVNFLRSTLKYYYLNGIYPFAHSTVADDFCKNNLDQSLNANNVNEFYAQAKKLRKKYKKRVRKVCKKGQRLDQNEIEAFDLANKIWGSRSGGKIQDHSGDKYHTRDDNNDN